MGWAVQPSGDGAERWQIFWGSLGLWREAVLLFGLSWIEVGFLQVRCSLGSSLLSLSGGFCSKTRPVNHRLPPKCHIQVQYPNIQYPKKTTQKSWIHLATSFKGTAATFIHLLIHSYSFILYLLCAGLASRQRFKQWSPILKCSQNNEPNRR